MSNGYKTKQKDAVLKYTHVTVNQISDNFAQHGTPVGVTTIYRHLEKLLEEGFIRKYTVDGASGACFQYAEDQQCREHFHLMCEKCGCLIHLECSHLSELAEHIFYEHGFQINPFRTVFYGKCKKCTDNEKNQEEK